MSTKIEWCDETINPIVGCTKISPACDNCYAEIMARRLAGMPHTKEKYSQVITNGKWNGKVVFDPKELEKPFRWKKPKRIFITSMGDLFHEKVEIDWLARVFATIFLNERHTFIILTKRPERMEHYLKNEEFFYLYHKYCNQLHDQYIKPLEQELYFYDEIKDLWPLSNLWLGVTAETQEQADKRIPILLQIPAAIHFVSCEPLLIGISLMPYLPVVAGNRKYNRKSQIDWVIAGGETGNGYREILGSYIYSLFDQCKVTVTPFFFKGWGGIGKKNRLLWNEIIAEFPYQKRELRTMKQ